MIITCVMLNFPGLLMCHHKILNRLSNNSANELWINPDSYKTMKMAFLFTEMKLQLILLICRMKMNVYTPP